jgi:hypothetical protein
MRKRSRRFKWDSTPQLSPKRVTRRCRWPECKYGNGAFDGFQRGTLVRQVLTRRSS